MASVPSSKAWSLTGDRLLQEHDTYEDHPNRGEHYARGCIREFCAYRARNFDRPIEGTLESGKHHHGTNQDGECCERQTTQSKTVIKLELKLMEPKYVSHCFNSFEGWLSACPQPHIDES
jgi:hypothetical protein